MSQTPVAPMRRCSNSLARRAVGTHAVVGGRSLGDDEVGFGRTLPLLELGHLARPVSLSAHLVLLLLTTPALLHTHTHTTLLRVLVGFTLGATTGCC